MSKQVDWICRGKHWIMFRVPKVPTFNLLFVLLSTILLCIFHFFIWCFEKQIFHSHFSIQHSSLRIHVVYNNIFSETVDGMKRKGKQATTREALEALSFLQVEKVKGLIVGQRRLKSWNVVILSWLSQLLLSVVVDVCWRGK